jgi:hypothetical protein
MVDCLAGCIDIFGQRPDGDTIRLNALFIQRLNSIFAIHCMNNGSKWSAAMGFVVDYSHSEWQ